MGQYAGYPDKWIDNIYQFEETDVVKGGADGIDNVPLKNLADRTAYLLSAMRGFEGVTVINASGALTLLQVLRKQVVIDANGAKVSISLPDIVSVGAGTRISLYAYNVNQSQVTISSDNPILLNGLPRGIFYMGDMENIELVSIGTSWMALPKSGNFLDAGAVEFRYKQIINTVIAQGQILNRVDYPRLWEYASGLGGSLIYDIDWQNSPNNKGFFSAGNGSTNFRVPDLRAMHIRALDLNANIDFARNSENPGGYEADEIKQHTHDYTRPKGDGSASGNAITHPDGPMQTGKTGATGGTETRVKNIGLLPLIRV